MAFLFLFLQDLGEKRSCFILVYTLFSTLHIQANLRPQVHKPV